MIYKELSIDDVKGILHGEYTPIAIEAIYQYLEDIGEDTAFDRVAILCEFFELKPAELFYEYSYLIGYECTGEPTPPECTEPTPEAIEKLFEAIQDKTYIETLDNGNYLLIAF